MMDCTKHIAVSTSNVYITNLYCTVQYINLYCTVSIHVFGLSFYDADEFRLDAQLLTFELKAFLFYGLFDLIICI